MGFYIRKSVSAGPFRFNLSRSGVGISVGVKGFRVGSGPRGNYVHMGRGGLYYRASLGGAHRSSGGPRSHRPKPTLPTQPPMTGDPLQSVETGNVVEMVPSNGSDIVRQINEKMARMHFWPWMLGGGLLSSAALAGQPDAQPFVLAMIVCTAALSILLAYIDVQRKTVVIMYDLSDDVLGPLKAFAQEFDNVALAARIWNIDTAGVSNDWKRNAGATRLITRKRAIFGYGVPKVIKTNIDLPSIVGGRQNVYFFPDVIIIIEGSHAGAISYQELNIYWGTTVLVEDEGVPPDAQIVGYTWRYVNKRGGPDRRFNNNRRLPQVLYQQMGLQGPGGFQKILQLSRVADRREFDTTFAGLRGLIKILEQLALPPVSGDTVAELRVRQPMNLIAPPGEQFEPPIEQPRSLVRGRSVSRSLATSMAILGIVFGIAVLVTGLHSRFIGSPGQPVVGPTAPTGFSTPSSTNGSTAGSDGFEPELKRSIGPGRPARPSFPVLGDGLNNWCKTVKLPSSIAICSEPELRALTVERQQAYDEARARLTRTSRRRCSPIRTGGSNPTRRRAVSRRTRHRRYRSRRRSRTAWRRPGAAGSHT